MYLLDTNVFSAARRPERNEKLASWLYAQRESELFVSVVSLGEIARCIKLQEKRNPDFAKSLSEWLNRTEALFKDRILPFYTRDARIWGELSAEIGHSGADLMIAASALSHQATVVTRNTSDFKPTGVKVLNPFDHR